jgi:ribosomal protein L37AE/L43A
MTTALIKASASTNTNGEVEAICEKCQRQLEVSKTFFAFNSLYIVWHCPECGCRFIAPANNKAPENERATSNASPSKRVIGNDMGPLRSNVRRPVEEALERKEMREARQTQRLYQKWQSLRQQGRTHLSWEEWIQRRLEQSPQRIPKLLKAIQKGDLHI